MHMTASWFEELMGFPEGSYQETKRNLEVVGETDVPYVSHRNGPTNC